jgi:hypothetical protein
MILGSLALGVASSAGAVTTLNKIITESDEERFMRLANTGLVENETFNFTRGLVFDDRFGRDVIVKNCIMRFPPLPGQAVIRVNNSQHGLTMYGCIMDYSHAKTGIHLEGFRDTRNIHISDTKFNNTRISI